MPTFYGEIELSITFRSVIRHLIPTIILSLILIFLSEVLLVDTKAPVNENYETETISVIDRSSQFENLDSLTDSVDYGFGLSSRLVCSLDEGIGVAITYGHKEVRIISTGLTYQVYTSDLNSNPGHLALK